MEQHTKILIRFVKNGFQKKYNINSYYGIGTYCSPNCQIAMDYTGHTDISFVLLCDCITNQNTIRDNLKKPMIYCFPDDAMVLPLYVIAFYKNAK